MTFKILWLVCSGLWKIIYILVCILFAVSFRVRVDRNPPTSCPMDTQYLSSTAWDYESSSPYNCNPQLSHSSPTSRIMLQRFSSTGPYVKVITTLSGGAVCMSLALTAMVEIESGDNTVTFRQCQMVFEDDDAAGFRRCMYTCLCEGPCPRVHLQFYSLQAIGTDNLGWSLCNIEMCVPSMHNELWNVNKYFKTKHPSLIHYPINFVSHSHPN